MRLRAAIAAVVVPVLLLAGCGQGAGPSPTSASGAVGSAGVSGSAGSDSAGSDSAGLGSAAAPSEAPTPGPTVPPETAVAAPVPADQLPTATGKIGEKPAFSFPKTSPPPSLQRQILVQGSGQEVKKGDWLITNYLGQVWGGKIFDNSYDRKKTTAFQIGVGKVVPGWDVAMAGVKVGSRILLSLPPADGYTSAGNPQAGIKGTDTIVFVVDILESIPADRGGQADAKAVPLPAKTAVTVSGKLGAQPSVKVTPKAAQPTKAQVLRLSTGTGPKLATDDQVLVQYQAVTWTNQPAVSTWPTANATPQNPGGKGPEQITVQKDSPFAALAGVTVGSRVLLLLPKATTAQGQSPAFAVVIDLVAKT